MTSNTEFLQTFCCFIFTVMPNVSVSACTCINLGWRHRSRTCWEKLHSQVVPSYKSYFILQYNRDTQKTHKYCCLRGELCGHRISNLRDVIMNWLKPLYIETVPFNKHLRLLYMVPSLTTQPVCFFIQRKRLVT